MERNWLFSCGNEAINRGVCYNSIAATCNNRNVSGVEIFTSMLWRRSAWIS